MNQSHQGKQRGSYDYRSGNRDFAPMQGAGPVPGRTSQPSHGRDDGDAWRDRRRDKGRDSQDKRRESSEMAMQRDNKHRESGEVQAALDRARQLQEEEEKRYEEKKRYEQPKMTGKKLRDPKDSREYPEDCQDQSLRCGGEPRDVRDYYRDNYMRDSHRDQRDQYDRPYDRRDGGRDQQMAKAPFRNKLPPRFQRLQQQDNMRSNNAGAPQPPFNRGPGGSTSQPYDSRYSGNQPLRYAGRENDGKFCKIVHSTMLKY